MPRLRLRITDNAEKEEDDDDDEGGGGIGAENVDDGVVAVMVAAYVLAVRDLGGRLQINQICVICKF